MGPFTLTGLPEIATALTTLFWLLGLLVVGLTAGVAVPALVRAHGDRVARHLSIPQYYGLTHAH